MPGYMALFWVSAAVLRGGGTFFLIAFSYELCTRAGPLPCSRPPLSSLQLFRKFSISSLSVIVTCIDSLQKPFRFGCVCMSS